MKKIERGELLPLAEYEAIRERFRARILEEKRARRMRLGDEMSMVFENRDTVLWQIQEMLRTERITTESGIRHELDTYNELVPVSGGLSATLFIEIADRERRDEMLTRLCAIEEHVSLELDGVRTRATFEEGRRDRGRAAAVQYLQFPLGPSARAALLRDGVSAAIVFDHPALAARYPLAPETASSLREDMLAS
jgi:hypothetical protein